MERILICLLRNLQKGVGDLGANSVAGRDSEKGKGLWLGLLNSPVVKSRHGLVAAALETQVWLVLSGQQVAPNS